MKRLLLLFLIPTLLFCRQKTQVNHTEAEPTTPFIPWLTGPFLAPTPVNMKLGHPAIQPSLTAFGIYGEYNEDWKLKTNDTIWSINPIVDFQFATTENTGVEILASYVSNHQDGKKDSNFEDTLVFLGYQVSDDIKDSWVPDFRLMLQINFPTGNYNKLDPTKRGIDSTGQGAFFFGPVIAFQKLFYLPCNFFMLHWSVGYLFPNKAHIKGMNAYGGATDTDGQIRPGQFFYAFLSGEYSFSQHLAFACDIQYIYQQKTRRFSGNPGTFPSGAPAQIGLPASMQFSITPSIEYSFSANAGLLFGSFLTLAGQNADAFASLFIAYLYIF